MFERTTWLTSAVVVFLTLAIWVICYRLYGAQGQLDAAETSVVALLVAALVFGLRWAWIKLRPPPPAGTATITDAVKTDVAKTDGAVKK